MPVEDQYLVAFEKIRASLVSHCVRHHLDFEAAARWEKTGRPFEAFSDASDIGWAVVLTQRERPRGTPLITALMSFRLGMAKFIIPFVFAFYPTVLIIEDFSWLPFIWIVARTVFCIWLFSTALSAFGLKRLNPIEIVLRLVAAFAVLATEPWIQGVALALGLGLVALHIFQNGSMTPQSGTKKAST